MKTCGPCSIAGYVVTGVTILCFFIAPAITAKTIKVGGEDTKLDTLIPSVAEINAGDTGYRVHQAATVKRWRDILK